MTDSADIVKRLEDAAKEAIEANALYDAIENKRNDVKNLKKDRELEKEWTLQQDAASDRLLLFYKAMEAPNVLQLIALIRQLESEKSAIWNAAIEEAAQFLSDNDWISDEGFVAIASLKQPTDMVAVPRYKAEELAAQKTSREMTKEERRWADWQGAYDTIINIYRDVLKTTLQTQKPPAQASGE